MAGKLAYASLLPNCLAPERRIRPQSPIKARCVTFCVVSAVTCPALLAPLNGIRQGCTGTTTENYNTHCLFSCNTGFNATGSPSRKCLESGTWSGEDFLCQGEITFH